MTSPPSRIAPFVVAIGGVPGAGKSTLGRALAGAARAALLDLDTLTNPLMARLAAVTGAGDNLDDPSLRGAVRDARYTCLRDTAADVLGAGCSVVLVAPFTAERADPRAWQAFSGQLLAPPDRPLLVEVGLAPELALARRRRRGLARDRSVGGPGGSAVPAPRAPSPVADLLADGAADPVAEAARLLAALRRSGDVR
jgi:hypothetical protein